jgi:hypothetical protein
MWWSGGCSGVQTLSQGGFDKIEKTTFVRQTKLTNQQHSFCSTANQNKNKTYLLSLLLGSDDNSAETYPNLLS